MLTIVMGILIFLLGLLGGFLFVLIAINPTGTILIDKSKDIDICRIELDKEISGKIALFNVKYVNNLTSASETYSIVEGGLNNE